MSYIEAIGSSYQRQVQQQAPLPCVPWIYTHQPQAQLKPQQPIKNIIAVASGKGGVGKSTVAFNLAYTLACNNLRVGLLDADIYGPSLPTLTGIHDKALARTDKKFEPHAAFGLSLLSIGHLVDSETALIWRGPMASGAMMQLFTQTAWPALDIMIVDLPPGTGDLLLTLCQKIPLVGVLHLSIDHPLALADLQRSKVLFERLGVTSFGTVLNHHRVTQHAPRDGHPIQLAYTRNLFESTACALPLALYEPEAPEVQAFQFLAEHVVDTLATRPLVSSIPHNLTIKI